MRRYTLVFSLLLSILLSFLFRLAIEHNLFWTLWWYNSMMHFLGGLSVGFLLFWFAEVLGARYVHISKSAFILFSVFSIGFAWEIFELYLGLPANPVLSYPVDTFKDLILDVLGPALVLALVSRKRLPSPLVEDGS